MALDLTKIKPAVHKAKEIATVMDIETAVTNFNTAITTTNSHVTTINNTLADIANDAKLTAGEKQAIKREWEVIVSEKTSLSDQADAFGISKETYINKYNTLNTYLNEPVESALLTNLTTTSNITSSTFTTKFKEYYTAKIDLLTALSAKAKYIADSKMGTSELNTELARTTTVIDGGRITTGLIDAQRISTQGLIAENISSTSLTSKTITGGSIDGAVITGGSISGVVIKASYLDLDGELEVLTNYHIPESSYNAATMLYAFKVSATEYRLPSISSIRLNSYTGNASVPIIEERAWSRRLTPESVLINVPIYPYDSYAVSSTNRCVKVRPNALTVDSLVIPFSAHRDSLHRGEYNATAIVKIYFGNLWLFTINLAMTPFAILSTDLNDAWHICTHSITLTGNTTVTSPTIYRNYTVGEWSHQVTSSNHGFVCTAWTNENGYLGLGNYGSHASGISAEGAAFLATISGISVTRPYNHSFEGDVTGNSGLRAVLESGYWPAESVMTIPNVALNNMA